MSSAAGNDVNMPKQIRQWLFRWLRPLCRLPSAIARVLQEKKQRIARSELEAERLDRICNPSKYLGK